MRGGGKGEFFEVPNKLFRGNPVARSSVFDFEECNTLCEKDRRCVAFSFLKDQENGQNCEIFNEMDTFLAIQRIAVGSSLRSQLMTYITQSDVIYSIIESKFCNYALD